MRLKFYLMIILGLPIVSTFAQSANEPYKIYGGLQFWMRYTELNPGSTVGQEIYDQTFDISIRRYRLGVKGQPYKNIRYNIQLGNNNLSRYQKDQPPKLLDAYVSYQFSECLIITGGKHGWNGLSRYAAPSTLSALGTDINFSGTPGLNAHDDFFRRLAIALHGRFINLDYRVVLSKPFSYTAPALSENAVFANNPTAMSISGYFKWQLADMETLSSAYHPWTYLGEKEIFNLGAGFTYQASATQSLNTTGDTLNHPMKSFAADLYYEKPFGKNVYTIYFGYLNHDLGSNFLRYIGANNPASGEAGNLSLNGKGNSFPEVGTGKTYFTNFAYLRKLNAFDLQPYVMLEIGDFDGLTEAMVLYEGGVNFLLDGHKSKLSVGLKSRPIFIDEVSGAVVDERRIMAVLQYQIRF